MAELTDGELYLMSERLTGGLRRHVKTDDLIAAVAELILVRRQRREIPPDYDVNADMPDVKSWVTNKQPIAKWGGDD